MALVLHRQKTVCLNIFFNSVLISLSILIIAYLRLLTAPININLLQYSNSSMFNAIFVIIVVTVVLYFMTKDNITNIDNPQRELIRFICRIEWIRRTGNSHGIAQSWAILRAIKQDARFVFLSREMRVEGNTGSRCGT